MRDFWKSFLACLPPFWRISPDPARRERFLKFAIIAAIFLGAGPELIAALEFQVLLELLGATMFTVAFVAGAKLLVLDFVASLRRILLPVAPFALVFLAFAEWWLATVAACVASTRALWDILV